MRNSKREALKWGLLLSLFWTDPAQAQSCEYPGVLIILDRSASMNRLIDGETRWAIAQDAVTILLQQHDEAAHFGLMLYPGPSGENPMSIDMATACLTDGIDRGCTPAQPRCTPGEVVVPIGPHTSAAIQAQLAWPDELSHAYTPTWQSLEAAHREPSLHEHGRRNFVILITDGWQCCDLTGGNSCGATGGPLVEKIEQLLQGGVTPFVLGFGSNVDVRSLQNMAIAAGTARPGCDPSGGEVGDGNHCYYQADDHFELTGMLDDIVRQISEELCDGWDNDCDGIIDGLTRSCQSACGRGEEICVNGHWMECNAGDAMPEECNGLDDDCDDLIDEDLNRSCGTACGPGSERCLSGQWTECDAPAPREERCNGEDDNCDGVVDEGCDCQMGESRACGNSEGSCQNGTQRCEANGIWGTCQGGIGPEAERCDGLDNDCDGLIDGLSEPCSTACGAGERRCERGEWRECDAPLARAEECNSLDDDCDGRIDEDLIRSCSNLCGRGNQRCEGGSWSQCDAREPIPEICGNGFDDNCDTWVDEECECSDGETQPCGVALGICEQGLQTCRDGRWGQCEGAFEGNVEICDGLDNDCDGSVDNGVLCAAGESCMCGACALPCPMGECEGSAGECIYGYCVVDNCPEGQICIEAACQHDGERLPDLGSSEPPVQSLSDVGPRPIPGLGAEPNEAAPVGDCNCQTTPSSPTALMLLMLGLLSLRFRRSDRN